MIASRIGTGQCIGLLSLLPVLAANKLLSVQVRVVLVVGGTEQTVVHVRFHLSFLA